MSGYLVKLPKNIFALASFFISPSKTSILLGLIKKANNYLFLLLIIYFGLSLNLDIKIIMWLYLNQWILYLIRYFFRIFSIWYFFLITTQNLLSYTMNYRLLVLRLQYLHPLTILLDDSIYPSLLGQEHNHQSVSSTYPLNFVFFPPLFFF